MIQEAEENITEIQNTRRAEGMAIQATRLDQSKMVVVGKSSMEMSKPAAIGIYVSTFNAIIVLLVDITVDGEKSLKCFPYSMFDCNTEFKE